MKDLTKDDFIVFDNDDDEWLRIYCKTKFMEQILKNQKDAKFKAYCQELLGTVDANEIFEIGQRNERLKKLTKSNIQNGRITMKLSDLKKILDAKHD